MAASDNIRSFRLNSADFKHSAEIGLFINKNSKFLPRPEIAVFKSDTPSGPIIKLIFSLVHNDQFQMVINKILTDPEAAPLTFGISFYNKELKQNEFRGSVTVGRDKDKVIYFELVGDRHKEPVVFPLLTDYGTSTINGTTVPKQQHSESVARTIIKLLESLKEIGAIIAKSSNGGEEGFDGGMPSNGSSETTFTPPPMGDDVPF